MTMFYIMLSICAVIEGMALVMAAVLEDRIERMIAYLLAVMSFLPLAACITILILG